MKASLRAALAAVLLCTGISAPAFAQIVPGQLTAARNLHATRTPQGYNLFGELQSSSTCMDTRFRPRSLPNTFAAEQYKRPHSGPMCGFIVTWKRTMISVPRVHVPHIVHVRVAGGSVVNVPVI